MLNVYLCTFIRTYTQLHSLSAELDDHNRTRLMFHSSELKENCEVMKKVFTRKEAKAALKIFKATLNHIHNHADRTKFSRWKPAIQYVYIYIYIYSYFKTIIKS